MLVRANADLPESFKLDGDIIVPGWVALSDADAAKVERAIAQAGWHWFWVVPSTSAVAYGRSRESATKRALQEASQEAESHGLNAIEIADLSVAGCGFCTGRRWP